MATVIDPVSGQPKKAASGNRALGGGADQVGTVDPFAGSGTVSSAPTAGALPGPVDPSQFKTPAGGARTDLGSGSTIANAGTGGATVTQTTGGGTPSQFTAGATDPLGQFMNLLSQFPGNPQGAIDTFNRLNPGNNLAPAWYANNSTIGLGNGTYLVAPNTGGNNSANWQTVPRSPESGSSAASVTPTAASMDPALHQAIMDLLARGTTPVSPDDPTIKSTVDAANVQGQRANQVNRAALAERAAAEGLPTSSFDTSIASANEQLGENLGGLQAQLMTQELQNRRQDVVNALSFATGQDQQALQLQLAQIDEALQQQSLTQQNQQFYDTLGFNIGTENSLLNSRLYNLIYNQ